MSEAGRQPGHEPGAAWTEVARRAAAPEDAPATGVRHEFVSFLLDGDPYAVPIQRVREIVRLRPITPVPRMPEAVRGVISLRGTITQVVDLRRRLAMPPLEPTRASRIIVVNRDDDVAGLLVDAVRDVMRVDEAAIRPAPAGDGDAVEALCARGDTFVSLLDIDRVLDVGSH